VKYCSRNLTERKGLRARKNQDSLTTTSAILSVYAAAQSASTIPEKSIAVLSFENRSEEKANAYFADGIQDEILTRLSKIADLKVISRTSTQHYKGAPENLPEIARQLGVAHILEGSVQKSGDDRARAAFQRREPRDLPLG
jgi:TolB-like protein